jgi:hypothetical protein
MFKKQNKAKLHAYPYRYSIYEYMECAHCYIAVVITQIMVCEAEGCSYT